MPRSAEANQVLREKTKERILQAAVRLFSRRGFDGASVRAIADEAKVALGLLYAHFDSKEALLRALMGASVLDVTQTLERADLEKTAAQFVSTLLHAAVELLDAHKDAWRLSYALRHQPDVLASLGPATKQFSATVGARLEKALRSRGLPNARLEAVVLFALVDGISQQYVQMGRAYPIEAVIEIAAGHYARFEPAARKAARKKGVR